MNNAFFDVCNPTGCLTCSQGPADLAGTGMTAGLSWYTMVASVVRGELMKLDLMVFDVSAGTGDTLVLADNLRWELNHEPNGCFPGH